MERLLIPFSEIRNQVRPSYVHDLEEQANRFMSDLTCEIHEQKLLDTGDSGVVMYHHGPEKKVVLGFPTATEEPTGRECVVIEFHHDKDAYHLVGSVDAAKKFTLVRLNLYKKDNGYCSVFMTKHKKIICTVTEILREIKPIQSVNAGD